MRDDPRGWPVDASDAAASGETSRAPRSWSSLGAPDPSWAIGRSPDCPSTQDLDLALDDAAGEESSVLRHASWCAPCARALAHLREERALLSRAARALHAGDVADAPPPGYDLVRELGRGGQGVVWLATHTATRRRVALKMLGAGRFATRRQRARFEREVDLAGQLRHPNIVTLYDAGSAQGRPYLAMEYVDGPSLDEFARSTRASRPGTEARSILLELARRVCAGVAYAHSRGVIHRDLKPRNVLVDLSGPAPEPRVVDFGLAKAADATDRACTTMDGSFAGTLAYAAPETLRAGAEAADTRADVYSLGVMLHELLTGRPPRPEHASLEQLVLDATTRAPAPPSSLDPTIDADLDTIVLRALAIDPQRRYQTVESLEQDLARAIRGEPIEARRDSAIYVLRKAVRRHRLSLGASVAVLAMLAGLSTKLVLLNRENVAARDAAEERRREAERQQARAEKLLSISLGALSGDFEGSTRRESVADVAEAAASRAERELGDDPAARARLLQSLSDLSLRTGSLDLANRLSEQALGDMEAAHGRESHQAANARFSRAIVLRRRGDWIGAEAQAREGLEITRVLYGDDDPWVARALLRVADATRGRADEAERLVRDAIAIHESSREPMSSEHARALGALGAMVLRRGNPTEAESLLRRAIELRAKDIGPLHPLLFPHKDLLSRALTRLGRLAEAEVIVRELYMGRTANRAGRQTAIVVATRRQLADLLVRLDRVDEALALFAEGPAIPLDAATTVAGTLLDLPDGAPRAEAILVRALRGAGARDDALADPAGSDGAPALSSLAAEAQPALAMLALSLARQGDHSRARALAQGAYERLAPRDGDSPGARQRAQGVLRMLVQVCELAGDAPAAAHYRSLLGAPEAPGEPMAEGVE